MTPAITELVEVCERLAARNRSLFELVGGWVADEADGRLQRLWSTAAHRHAWHADLWAARQPAIPVDAPAADEALAPVGDDRVAWYRDQLTELIADTTAVAVAVDPDLDPATARVTRLVLADLDELTDITPRG